MMTEPVYTFNRSPVRITEFKGYNARGVRDDGEMRDMMGLCSDEYPMLSVASAVSHGAGFYAPVSMMSKSYADETGIHDSLAILHWNNIAQRGYVLNYKEADVEGLILSRDTQMVGINDKICFFPEKKWYSVVTGEIGDMDAQISLENAEVFIGNSTKYNFVASTITFPDGTDLSMFNEGDALDMEFDGDVINVFRTIRGTAGDFIFFRGRMDNDKVVQSTYAYYVNPPSAAVGTQLYAKLEVSGGWTELIQSKYTTKFNKIGAEHDIKEFEAGPLSGSKGFYVGIPGKSESLVWIQGSNTHTLKPPVRISSVVNTSAFVKEVKGNVITFNDNAFMESSGKQITGWKIKLNSITVKRVSPDLDYVIEWNNRLWGCSNKDNTIYASKLGDPTNWTFFQTTALDSYAAEQGSNGRWTGVGKYSTHLLFFKEDCIHKVYGNYPSEFQIVTQMCSGCEEGSSKSIVTMEDGVFYKSRRGIMAYTGGAPTLISSELGRTKYKDAVAGASENKYYVTMKNLEDEPITFTYDVDLGMWHKHSTLNIIDYEWYDGRLYAVENVVLKRTDLLAMETYGDAGHSTELEWFAEFGPFDEYEEDEKVYSIVKLRYDLPEQQEIPGDNGKPVKPKISIEISVDDGEWELVETVTEKTAQGYEVKFVPRRCDHFAIRLSGRGYCRVKSMVREFRLSTGQKENY